MIQHSKPFLGVAESEATRQVLRSATLVGGSELEGLRLRLRQLTGRNVSLFSSGRAAICAALRALSLPRGAGVIVQTYVCDAVVWAIRTAGLEPEFCDIGPGWTASPETAEAARTRNTAALILAPPFGLHQSRRDFALLDLPIIHDLCQASPEAVASFALDDGNMTTLSFHPTKYLCGGVGGAIISGSNDKLAEAERVSIEAFPFDELSAAVLNVQFSRLKEFAERRTFISGVYAEAAGASAEKIQTFQDVKPGQLLRFPMQVPGGAFEQLARTFEQRGIVVRRGVDQLSHRRVGLSDSLFPNAVTAFETTLSPPFYPALVDEEVSAVADALAALL